MGALEERLKIIQENVEILRSLRVLVASTLKEVRMIQLGQISAFSYHAAATKK